MSLLKTSKILKNSTPYVAGLKSKKNPLAGIILSANENPIGADKAVIEKIKNNLTSLHRYPYALTENLISTISAKHNLAEDMLTITSGSSEALSLVARAYLNPSDEVIITEYGFLLYAIFAKSNYAKVVYAKDENKKASYQNILNAITDKTKIIYLTNPNNPTGSYLNRDEIKKLINSIPSDVILVIDCAYEEYVEAKDYDCGIDYIKTHKNVIYIRTFSKIHGLASLRLGWAYADKTIIDNISKIKPFYNVTQPALIAGIQALSNDDHIIKSKDINSENKAWLTRQLKKIGLIVYPSEGNFILVDFSSIERADYIYNNLLNKQIYIRIMTSYKLPTCLRITIGLKSELIQLVNNINKLFIKL